MVPCQEFLQVCAGPQSCCSAHRDGSQPCPAGHCQPQDGARHWHGCFQPGGTDPFQELTAGDSRQPVLRWVTPTPPVLDQYN